MKRIINYRFFLGCLLGLWIVSAESSPYSATNEAKDIAGEKGYLVLENKQASLVDGISDINEPEITVKNIPIPAAILLFGPAVVCLLGLKAKRK